ncbi:MAG: polysaccharide deacetylase family protein [Rickettsiales bacterium]|jgi:hypothetical protein|nr:polysaccharide deacetylase family protein [Rickettsiales bacterium]
MILTYHNIGEGKGDVWVGRDSFARQMKEISDGGFQVVRLDEYDSNNPKHIVLTFDDGRKNIFDAVQIMKKHRFPFYVFVVENLIGSSDEFLSRADFNEIKRNGGILGWHTKTHADLTTLSKRQIMTELKNPYGFDTLAYPHWKYNKQIKDIARKLGYRYARAGNGFSGNDNLSLDSFFVRDFTEITKISFQDRIVKYIDMALFSFPCNMRCHYCYVGQYATDIERATIMPARYSPADLEKALNKKRMGGTCVVTFSTAGETLLLPQTMEYLKAVLNAGHFLHISTNLTITKHIDELLSMTEEIRSRLFFKASVQYLELKRLDLLGQFARNCRKIWDAGATCALEVVPNDELIPYIPELKDWCLRNFGALPHLSMPRDELVPEVKLLSKYSLKEFAKVWEDFYSEEFRFKVEMWERPVKDFCYAGKVSCFVIINTGQMLTCPKSKVIGNFFEGEKLYEEAAAKCPQEHCFVCHNWLGFGSCPAIDGTNYLLQRDRVTADGKHWVSPRCRNAFRQRVCDNNELYSAKEEAKLYKIAEKEQSRERKKR